MGVESATYVNDLDSALPAGADAVSQGDDHLRLLKAVAKTTFPDAARAYRLPGLTLLTADRSLTNGTGAQALFGFGEDAFTAAANTAYEVEAILNIDRSGGGGAGYTATFPFGGTATFTSWMLSYWVMSTILTVNYTTSISSTALNQLVNTDATANAVLSVGAPVGAGGDSNRIMIRGIMRSNGAGTIIPQINYSAAPGSAPSLRKNSYYRFHPLGADTIASIGAWA